jgi:uncharacterized protein YggU (UPF0235/DUF167 family)
MCCVNLLSGSIPGDTVTVGRTISIRLVPGAAANRVGESRLLPDGEEQLVVCVTAIAEDGKANRAMIRLLARHFGVAPSGITIVRGFKSRNKIVEIPTPAGKAGRSPEGLKA